MEYFFNFEKMAYIKGHRPVGCILCLIRDESPEVVNLTVYRTEYFLAVVNLYPYNPGHLMVFPRRHLLDIREYTVEEEMDLARVNRLLLDVLDRTHAPRAYNIGYNMGPVAGASIDHIHLHIIPRYPRETGIADLLAGKRVLVEDPLQTTEKIRGTVAELTGRTE
ncbi:MAG TPA: HIT domain-containing protein [Spirochaetia bacterium]|nr:HIT domain-containing protein [Spirochaetia bacterium]